MPSVVQREDETRIGGGTTCRASGTSRAAADERAKKRERESEEEERTGKIAGRQERDANGKGVEKDREG